MRAKWAIAAATLVAGSMWVGWAGARYDSRVWLEEFDTLLDHMAKHYANLDWMVEHRKMDLPALRRSTEAAIRSAHTGWQARRALTRFVEAFRDPHLRLVRGVPTSQPPDRAREAGTCEERGYWKGDRGFRFPFEEAADWRPAGGPWFPAGSFGDIGVLRVADFREKSYREACEAAGPDRVRERLQEELRATILELRSRQVRVLVLDITGNGGGSEWVLEVTRLLTAKALRRPKVKSVEPPCDRSAIWDGARVCPVLTGEGEETMQGEGNWDSPLAVLVDGRTASASEDLIVWLQESHAATIIGERTYGAGCGYVDGGAPARLERIDCTVLMPNCARFTADGVNEIEGIAPDVVLPLREGKASERLRRLADALPRAGSP